MCKTAEFSPHQRKILFSVVLLTVAFCLIAHFLVEDAFLPRIMDTSAQNYFDTSLTIEMEHLDDLVMTIDLPESIPYNRPLAITAWSIHIEQQLASPIHIPPKIA